MKSLVIKEPHNFELVDKAMPECGENEVVVKVAYAGICGSDMHILHGNNPFVVYPRISGHEFSGVIEQVGNKVTNLCIGTHVVVDPVINCGHCRPCRNGRANSCLNLKVIGVHRDGGFSEYQVVPASNVYSIAKDVPLKQAALVEPYTIAANVFDRLKPCEGDTVLIYGSGVIGLTLVQVAKVLGIPSIVVDIVDEKLALAKELGAERVINSKSEDVETVIMELTDGEGIPLIVDAACIPSLVPQIMRLAAPAGSVCLLGFLSEPSELMQMEVIKKELTIVGSRLNNKMFAKVIPWVESGQLNTEAIVSHQFAFDDFSGAIEQLEESPASTRKVLLKF
ncbi:Zn-dependent oxidoreductase [Vibrio parahaemolyticus]|nr:Zn-dependent oxidoreductase [Vibrio parahaemolyticus]